MQPCTTIERPITSQTFNCSDTTWNVALPFLSAATVAMYPAIVLSGVLYTSPQLWRRGENGGEEGREAEMGKGGESRGEGKEAETGMGGGLKRETISPTLDSPCTTLGEIPILVYLDGMLPRCETIHCPFHHALLWSHLHHPHQSPHPSSSSQYCYGCTMVG